MPNTPFFPAWRPGLAALGSRTARIPGQVRSSTLCQRESCRGAGVPAGLFPKAPDQENSRDRPDTRGRACGCLLGQSLNPDASGREVVRQLQAVFGLEKGPNLSEDDGAYCRAKARLALSEFPKAWAATGPAADRLAPALSRLQGRPLKAVDGSALTLPATLKNRNAYPPLHPCSGPQRPRFPMMRLVVFFSVLRGAVSLAAQGSLDALRHFSQALARARSKKKRRELWVPLLPTLAADWVPERPGRREPRAVKRKKNKYPGLNVSRHKFRDRPKRNVRRQYARRRRLGLM